MTMGIYLIWDSAALTFSPPFLATNHKVASRQFMDAIKDRDYPDEYLLWYLGSYDQQPPLGKEVDELDDLPTDFYNWQIPPLIINTPNLNNKKETT